MYDPLVLTEEVKRLVQMGNRRKYYRFRGGRWYGGIATADCVGCNMKCIFCWSNYPRDNPEAGWKFYSPEEVHSKLSRIAERNGYSLLRVSGNEPTICWDHLLELLEFIESEGKFRFILETNGILIGSDKSKAEELSRFESLHVRVSLKGACEEEFSLLTGAKPEAFELQLNALRNLADYGVSAHPAAMLSFSSRENVSKLILRLREVDPKYAEGFEEEYVFLYPHVKERLRKVGLKPILAYESSSLSDDFCES